MTLPKSPYNMTVWWSKISSRYYILLVKCPILLIILIANCDVTKTANSQNQLLRKLQQYLKLYSVEVNLTIYYINSSWRNRSYLVEFENCQDLGGIATQWNYLTTKCTQSLILINKLVTIHIWTNLRIRSYYIHIYYISFH